MGLVPGGTDGWYQQVPLAAYQLDDDGVELVIHGEDGDTPLAYRDDFAVAGDPLRESTSIRAEVVYVGHGVHAPDKGYSDYAGVDVSGKIVAMFRDAPALLEVPGSYRQTAINDLARPQWRRGVVLP